VEQRKEPDNPSEELSVRAGSHTGWTADVDGTRRCKTIGHEAADTLTVQLGVLVAYCVRCGERFEMPWVRGGTAAALGKAMALEALDMTDPAFSVFEDLHQVNGLLCDDAAAMIEAKNLVASAIAHTLRRIHR
jgi:hypothetical protein